MRISSLLVAAATAVGVTLVVPAPAPAAVVTPVGAGSLQSATSGIVLGPDGNLWVAEQYSGSVAQMSPSGTVLRRFAVGGHPASVTNGPGNRVWVTGVGTNDLQLTWFDATAPVPTSHPITSPNTCAPAAIAAGGDGRMYFSLPASAGCNGDISAIASIADTGTGAASTTAVPGPAYDLAVAGGRLFVPDYEGDAVRRYSLAASPVLQSTLTAPGGSLPDGITVDGAGTVWVTANGTGNLLRAPATQDGGSMQVVVPTGGVLSEPFGIVPAPGGGVWAAGKASGNLVRVRADGTTAVNVTTAGSQPFDLALGPDGDVFASDQAAARVLRVVDAAPRVAGATAASTGRTTASVTTTVDPRGNATQVVVDYGTTTAYGATTAPLGLPAGVIPLPVSLPLPGLRPGTTYHVRVRATNALGTVTGPDTTVTTPPGAVLRTAKAPGGRTRLKSLQVPTLAKGDKVEVTCKGKSCPARAKPVKAKKAGTLTLTALVKGAVLAPGAKVVVTVTSAGTTSTTTFTMVKGKKPRVG